MNREERAAWDRYYAAAVRSISGQSEAGSPAESFESMQRIAIKAADMADLMLQQRQQRLK
ncbi:hypothetical protein [Pseudomonas sp. BF-R-12]|uniref:hypothetical protein n=1 Tax=Pseudomonas sp. BF-R-12 TaxID=2832363 RepID=UPI001CBFC2F0|nr:hypothetical protein [Pseudomonas sp. BF-R-12]